MHWMLVKKKYVRSKTRKMNIQVDKKKLALKCKEQKRDILISISIFLVRYTSHPSHPDECCYPTSTLLQIWWDLKQNWGAPLKNRIFKNILGIVNSHAVISKFRLPLDMPFLRVRVYYILVKMTANIFNIKLARVCAI